MKVKQVAYTREDAMAYARRLGRTNVMQERQLSHQSQPRSRVVEKTNKQPKRSSLYIFRLWINNTIHHLHLDLNDTRDEYYNIIVTEDVESLSPEFVYGTCQSTNCAMFCLVKFKEHGYIDVVPRNILVNLYPSLERCLVKQAEMKAMIATRKAAAAAAAAPPTSS